MQHMILLLGLSGYFALGQCSLNELPVHPGVGGFYKGPNSETIIKGPDGSVITAQAEGGSIATYDLSQPIVVADTVEVEPLQSVEPIVSVTPLPAVPVATVTPVVAVSPAATTSPVVAPIAVVAPVAPAIPVAAIASVVPHTIEVIQPNPHIIETEIVDAPVVEPQESTDLIGPSGSISTRGSSSIVSGPASTTISEPARILVARPLVAAVPVISTVTTPLRAVPIVETVNGPATPIVSPISTVTVGPPIVTASPQVLAISVAPPTELNSATVGISSISTLAPSTGAVSTTLAPLNQQTALVSTNIGASIQPASSNGVLNSLDNTIRISSTPRPEIVLSSTLTPFVSGQGVSTTPTTVLDHIDNTQLNINPSLIPSANIIPPEIGPLPPGVIDLGSTVTVSTTSRTPGVIPPTESPNIQRIDDGNSIASSSVANINGDQQTSIQTNQISVQNQVHLTANGPSPQLPVGILRDGVVGSQLANYGIDSSQIDLASVPLSSVSGFPQTLDQEIDEVSAHLWNRYGRDVKEKKEGHQKDKNKKR